MAAGPRTLTQRELNRALLARQHLLERARTTLPATLERIGGLQAQYAPSMYLGLWSRLQGFQRADLTGALAQRTAVQGTLMRATIHLVSAGDYWPFAVATRRKRQEGWLRFQGSGLSAREMAAAAESLRTRMAGGTLRRAEIEKLLGKTCADGVGLWLDLVRAPPSGTWERRRADLYAAAQDWLGPEQVAPADALDHLVRRYLHGFGPARRQDIANFAGLLVGDVTPALERVALRRFRNAEGEELLDVPDAPLPEAQTPAPARFLPVWDATLLVHARRTGILPERYRPLVFNTKTPHSVPTFLVDGAVAGTWKYDDGRVQLAPFTPIDGSARRELSEEAERLAEFHA